MSKIQNHDTQAQIKLPWYWTPTYNLKFPLSVKYKGDDLWFDNYEEYHEFIYYLFTNKK